MTDLFLRELVIYSLIFGEILVKDNDLALNRNLADFFFADDAPRERFAVFADLVANGLKKILTLPILLFKTAEIKRVLSSVLCKRCFQVRVKPAVIALN